MFHPSYTQINHILRFVRLLHSKLNTYINTVKIPIIYMFEDVHFSEELLGFNWAGKQIHSDSVRFWKGSLKLQCSPTFQTPDEVNNFSNDKRDTIHEFIPLSAHFNFRPYPTIHEVSPQVVAELSVHVCWIELSARAV